MRIYEHKPQYILRVHIHRMGEERLFLSIIGTNIDEFIKYLNGLIKSQSLDPFAKGFRTKICIREAMGGENLGSKSVSFKGLSSQETYNLIVKDLNK